MIRQRENPVMWQAGALSLLVHGIFFMLLVMTFSWKSVAPMQVAEVQLWDSLPTPVKVQPTKPVPKVEPPPAPEIEPKPEPAPEPKAEIQLKPKPPVKPKPEPKPEKKPKEEAPKPDPKLQARKEEEKRLEDLKRAMLAEDDPSKAQENEARQLDAARTAQAQAAATASKELDAVRARIAAKIRQKVMPKLCGNGKPELIFAIGLMPTGELSGKPRLLKSSELPTCDQAVESAILQAQPFSVPPELFAQLRDLNLKFRPNDDN